jgi:glycosyltransferase involved in cell wall biosynthesis
MSKKVICIISQSHLCRNPRVLKEAVTLAQNGYIIHVLNGIYSAELLQQDIQSIKGYDIFLHPVSNLSARNYKSFVNRVLYKAGNWLVKYMGYENSLALGYGSYAYYKKAKAIKADLYIGHQEIGTCIGAQLLKSGHNVAFDLEDWYSEDLLPAAREGRPVILLQKAESFALKHGRYCTTTSNALAKKLAEVYTGKAPSVIYNVFYTQSSLLEKQVSFSKPLKLFWFSQTIGTGRGLEQFIKLSAVIKTKFQLHLLGNVDDKYRAELYKLMPAQHELYLHPLIEESQLPFKIAEFDIGLALELDSPESRNYTITNKFFQYMQSGLPVIMTETEGQNEGFEKFKQGYKLSQNPSAGEIAGLDKWLGNTLELKSARERTIQAAHFYNWENESKKLLTLVETAIEK